MKKLNKKGFTLIELLAVIVILAIVAAVSMMVIVPLLGGKSNEAAVTSAKEINKQIANACSAGDVIDAYGNFEAAAYYTDSTKATAATKADCSTATGCYIELSGNDASSFIKGMNISGDMPAHVKMTIASCQVQTACIDYKDVDGGFKDLKVETDANGKVTSVKGDC